MVAIKKRAENVGGIAVAALLIAGLFLIFGWRTYPAFFGDAPVFIPTAIQFAAGEGWGNGIGMYLYPAPLFPMVVSWLMPDATPQGAFFVLSVFSAMNVLLCGLLFYKAASWRGRPVKGYDTLLIIMSLGGVASWLLPGQGRPEVFASLLLLAGTLAFLYWSERWRDVWLWLAFGTLLTLMAASNPNGALLFALLIFAVCSLRYRGRQWAYNIVAVAVPPLAAVGMLLVLYPERATSMIEGVVSVGRYLLSHDYLLSPEYSIISYFIVAPQAPCYGLVFLFAVAGGAHLLCRRWDKVASPRWCVFFITSFFFFAYYTSIRQPNRRYNVLLFAPVFFALGIYYVSSLPGQRSFRTYATRGSYIVLMLLASAGFVRNVALFPIYLRDGMSMNEAREAFDQLALFSKTQGDVLVSGPAWTFSEQYDRMQYCRATPVHCGEGNEWFVTHQQFSGRKAPQKQIEGYVLRENFFVPVTPQLLGIKLANSMRGYSFAVYRREERAKN